MYSERPHIKHLILPPLSILHFVDSPRRLYLLWGVDREWNEWGWGTEEEKRKEEGIILLNITIRYVIYFLKPLIFNNWNFVSVLSIINLQGNASQAACQCFLIPLELTTSKSRWWREYGDISWPLYLSKI